MSMEKALKRVRVFDHKRLLNRIAKLNVALQRERQLTELYKSKTESGPVYKSNQLNISCIYLFKKLEDKARANPVGPARSILFSVGAAVDRARSSMRELYNNFYNSVSQCKEELDNASFIYRRIGKFPKRKKAHRTTKQARGKKCCGPYGKSYKSKSRKGRFSRR